MKFNKWTLGLAACAAVMIASAVKADNTASQVSNLMPTNLPAPASQNLGGFLTTALSVLDTNANYFTDVNQFEFSTGLDYDSAIASVDQAVILSYWRQIKPQLSVGPSIEFDSLGSGGQSLDAVEADFLVRYDYHNIDVAAGVGEKHLFKENTDGLEVAIQAEYWLSQHFGAFFKNALDFNLTGKDQNKSDIRLAAGITGKF